MNVVGVLHEAPSCFDYIHNVKIHKNFPSGPPPPAFFFYQVCVSWHYILFLIQHIVAYLFLAFKTSFISIG